MTDHSDDAFTTPASSQDVPPSFWKRWGEMIFAAGVVVLGIVVLVEAQDIQMRAGVAVSPRVVPNIVGVGLILVGLWYAVDIIRTPHRWAGGEDSEDVDPEAETDWSVIFIIAIALTLYALLINPAGFIVASAVLFFVSAYAMGSRHYLRDAIIGLIVAVAIFVVFDGWLGVRLPDGWFETLL